MLAHRLLSLRFAFLAVLLMLLGLAGVAQFGIPSRALASLRSGAESLAVVRERQLDLRPALYGETECGRAWDAYVAAIREMRKERRFVGQTNEAVNASTDPERQARDQVLQRMAPALELLAEGARRDNATSQVLVRNGLSTRVQKSVDIGCLGELGVAQAQALVEQGESLRAVQHLLDVQQLARDLIGSPWVDEARIGCALLVPPAMDRFLEPDGLVDFEPDAILLWLGGVERLLGNLPSSERAVAGTVEAFAWETVASTGKGKQMAWAAQTWLRGRDAPSKLPWNTDRAMFLEEQTEALASLTAPTTSALAVPSLDGFQQLKESRANALHRLAKLRSALIGR